MDDWQTFVSTAALPTEEDELERNAEALIRRLESFGQRTAESRLPAAPTASLASKRMAFTREVEPIMEDEEEEQEQGYHEAHQIPLDDPHDPYLDGGFSEASDSSSASGQASQRLYEHARSKQQQQLQQLSSTSSASSGKENGGGVHAPHINERSKVLVGKHLRDGDIGERLHVEGREREARRRAAINEADEARHVAEAEGARHAVPEINGVSAQLTAGREGTVANRLFDHAKESARRHEERAKDAERFASAAARPNVSTGSERIAAAIPGREAPVQERLYATAAERQEKLLRASCVPEEERMPAISDTSRRLAERAHAGLSLQDRLANKSGACPSRPSSMPTELLEATHAPTINAKSERLATQMQARAWSEGNVSVEDRLIASAAKEVEDAPLPVQKPQINPMSEKILQRRGPIAPLEERLTQPVKHVRPGIGSELDLVTLAPEISVRSRKLANKGGPRQGSIADRLNAWGAKHQRGDGNSDLADLKYKFGGRDDEPPQPSQRSGVPMPRAGPRAERSGGSALGWGVRGQSMAAMEQEAVLTAAAEEASRGMGTERAVTADGHSSARRPKSEREYMSDAHIEADSERGGADDHAGNADDVDDAGDGVDGVRPSGSTAAAARAASAPPSRPARRASTPSTLVQPKHGPPPRPARQAALKPPMAHKPPRPTGVAERRATERSARGGGPAGHVSRPPSVQLPPDEREYESTHGYIDGYDNGYDDGRTAPDGGGSHPGDGYSACDDGVDEIDSQPFEERHPAVGPPATPSARRQVLGGGSRLLAPGSPGLRKLLHNTRTGLPVPPGYPAPSHAAPASYPFSEDDTAAEASCADGSTHPADASQGKARPARPSAAVRGVRTPCGRSRNEACASSTVHVSGGLRSTATPSRLPRTTGAGVAGGNPARPRPYNGSGASSGPRGGGGDVSSWRNGGFGAPVAPLTAASRDEEVRRSEEEAEEAMDLGGLSPEQLPPTAGQEESGYEELDEYDRLVQEQAKRRVARDPLVHDYPARRTQPPHDRPAEEEEEDGGETVAEDWRAREPDGGEAVGDEWRARAPDADGLPMDDEGAAAWREAELELFGEVGTAGNASGHSIDPEVDEAAEGETALSKEQAEEAHERADGMLEMAADSADSAMLQSPRHQAKRLQQHRDHSAAHDAVEDSQVEHQFTAQVDRPQCTAQGQQQGRRHEPYEQPAGEVVGQLHSQVWEATLLWPDTTSTWPAACPIPIPVQQRHVHAVVQHIVVHVASYDIAALLATRPPGPLTTAAPESWLVVQLSAWADQFERQMMDDAQQGHQGDQPTAVEARKQPTSATAVSSRGSEKTRRGGARGEVRISYAPAHPKPNQPASSLLEAAEQAEAEARAEAEAEAEARAEAKVEGEAAKATGEPAGRQQEHPSSRQEHVLSEALRREDSAMQARDEAFASRDAARNEATAARSESKRAAAEAEGLRQRLEETEAALERARSAANEVSQEMDEMRRGVRSHGDAARSYEAQVASLQAEREAERQEQRQAEERLQARLHEMRREHEHAVSRAEAAERGRREAEAEASELRTALKVERAEITRQREAACDEDAVQRRLEGEMERRLEREVSKVSESLRAKLERCEAELRDAQQGREREAANLREARDEALGRASRMQREIDGAREAHASEIAQLKAELKAELHTAQVAAAIGAPSDAGGGSGGGGGGSGDGSDREEVARLGQELAEVREELRKSQEEQLGAALRARRKEKELKEQLRKHGVA